MKSVRHHINANCKLLAEGVKRHCSKIGQNWPCCLTWASCVFHPVLLKVYWWRLCGVLLTSIEAISNILIKQWSVASGDITCFPKTLDKVSDFFFQPLFVYQLFRNVKTYMDRILATTTYILR